MDLVVRRSRDKRTHYRKRRGVVRKLNYGNASGPRWGGRGYRAASLRERCSGGGPVSEPFSHRRTGIREMVFGLSADSPEAPGAIDFPRMAACRSYSATPNISRDGFY